MATQHTYTLAIGTRAACGNRKQGRVWQYTLGSPGPVLQRTWCGVRRNRVALTHANYGQRRVWQYTLAISAACGNTRWQSVPRVASRGYQCRAWLALCADPETQDLSPLDVSVGGRTPSRRSLGFKIPQTRQGLSGHLFSHNDYQVVCQGVLNRVPFTGAHSHISHNSIHLLLLRF